MPRVLLRKVTAIRRRKGSRARRSWTRPKDVAVRGGKGMQEILLVGGFLEALGVVDVGK